MPLMRMQHETDPKEEVRKRTGDLSGIEVPMNQVLVGLYQRPDKTASGIILADRTRAEDQHQGKSGLVLKMGPKAFVSDEKYDFGNWRIDEGDWVVFKVSDGWPITINQKDGHCRLLADVDIRCRVEHPDIVW